MLGLQAWATISREQSLSKALNIINLLYYLNLGNNHPPLLTSHLPNPYPSSFHQQCLPTQPNSPCPACPPFSQQDTLTWRYSHVKTNRIPSTILELNPSQSDSVTNHKAQGTLLTFSPTFSPMPWSKVIAAERYGGSFLLHVCSIYNVQPPEDLTGEPSWRTVP